MEEMNVFKINDDDDEFHSFISKDGVQGNVLLW